MNFTNEGLLKLLIWAKYSATGDDNLFDMDALIKASADDITPSVVSRFEAVIDAGEARSYIKDISKSEEYDKNE